MSVHDLYRAGKLMRAFVGEVVAARDEMESEGEPAGSVSQCCPKDGTPMVREPRLDGDGGPAWQCQVCEHVARAKRPKRKALRK